MWPEADYRRASRKAIGKITKPPSTTSSLIPYSVKKQNLTKTPKSKDAPGLDLPPDNKRHIVTTDDASGDEKDEEGSHSDKETPFFSIGKYSGYYL